VPFAGRCGAPYSLPTGPILGYASSGWVRANRRQRVRSIDVETNRYHRQALLPQVGAQGQQRLVRGRVLLVGCGALGSVIAEQLVRAGVGWVRIADRDWVELTNLQRQVLFDERDAAEQTPKAVAAARRLAQINSAVNVEPRVVDVHPGNIEELMRVDGRWVDVVVDGTDNVDTRYLINDVCVKEWVPWVYGACVGTEGRCMTVASPDTACLRCVFPEVPAPGELPTCDTAGVLGPAATVVGALQATEAIRILLGNQPLRHMLALDLWAGRFRSISLEDGRRSDCPACGQRRFEFLENQAMSRSTSLCGRNAIQIRPARPVELNLQQIATKLAAIGQVEPTPYLLRCSLDNDVRITVFPDGRAIIQGVVDADRARSLYARFVGS
jgi:molybdopterin-synthase adenylyltransferase